MSDPEQKEIKQPAIQQEIERRFLVAELPNNLETFPSVVLRTGYLTAEEGSYDRIRQEGKTYERTIKTGGGMSHQESTTTLTKGEFEELWTDIIVGVDKTRYRVPIVGGVAELDIWHGKEEGVVTVDVEFDKEEDAHDFMAPEWFGRETTHDERYKSRALIELGFPEEAFILH